jgi:hypothetical protein
VDQIAKSEALWGGQSLAQQNHNMLRASSADPRSFPRLKAVAQCRGLPHIVDVQDFDLNATVIRGQVMQLGGATSGPDCTDDVPFSFQEFGGHGVAKTARCANEQNGAGGITGDVTVGLSPGLLQGTCRT